MAKAPAPAAPAAPPPAAPAPAAPVAARLAYPGTKYAALHLLLCRWLRHYAQPTPTPYQYVTLGGTEFIDVRSMHFIDPALLGNARSFETDGGRFATATAAAAVLGGNGINVQVQQGDLFDVFVRVSDAPHIFYIDCLGICAFGERMERFATFFQNETIREGDCFLITSYMPPRVGWDRVYDTFAAEFHLLGAVTVAQRQQAYRRHHPAFTLRRALAHVDLADTLAVRCFGGIAYRSRSPMGVYGFTVEEGSTVFADLTTNVPWHTAAYGQELP